MPRLWKRVYTYFDKLEDRVRFRLSRRPVVYSIIGAVGIILVWKGVWDMADTYHVGGLFAFVLGLAILLMTGLMVSFFIGDSIILSGFKKEKKLVDKTESELIEEQVKMDRLSTELRHIEHEIEDIKKRQGPRMRL